VTPALAPLRQAHLDASHLKLAARARLLEAGKQAPYEAAVLYHAAARAERRALLAAERPSPEARLAAAIEVCGCLIDGRDPTAVLDSAWGEVLDATARVPDKTARAMRARLDPDRNTLVAEYTRTLVKLPALRTHLDATEPAAAPAALRRDTERYLAAFPGDARIWGLRSTLDLAAGAPDRAWDAIRRALALAPDTSVYRRTELHLLPSFLPPADAAVQLDAVHAEVARGAADADLCFGFLDAALQLADRTALRERLLQQALDAATTGWALSAAVPLDRKIFHAMQFGLREILAGRRPDADVLYRAGLGAWAAASPEDADPVAIVLGRMTPARHLRAA
jgi:hypothetical protein